MSLLTWSEEPSFNVRNAQGLPFQQGNVGVWQIVPAIKGLLDKAHAAGVPVVFVQSIRNHTEPHYNLYGVTKVLKIGTPASEFFDEITPQHPRDIVVRKWDHDPWFETDLDRVLKGIVPDPLGCQVLVTGGSITGFALHGAMGFQLRNYPTFIVMDAVYGNPVKAGELFSRTRYPSFPNIQLTNAGMISFSSGKRGAGAAPAHRAAAQA